MSIKLSYLATQCPAVTTCCLLISDPPHLLEPIRMYACQGKEPNPASVPPTTRRCAPMRLVSVRPHAGGVGQSYISLD